MKFYIPDRSGHTTLEFTPAQKAESDAKFRALIGEGRTAATRQAGVGNGDYTVIREPGQVQDETLFVPRLKGG